MDNIWTPIRPEFGSGCLEMIDPRKIEQHDVCQPRVNGTDPKVVAAYASDMRDYDASTKDNTRLGWQQFKRIECVKTAEDTYILYSGFHRLAAMLKVGYETIEVYYVDGTLQDAVILSKGENADNGIRRTNADKAHVVQSCLLDDALKKWSNEQIAEWCGVAPKTVKNHEDRLCKSQSGKDYQRPTVRFYLKPDGSIGEKDTSEIGKRDPAGCRKALKKQLTAQENLDDIDTAELSKTYNLTTAQVKKLRDEVWESELARARKRWEKSYTKVRTDWMNDEALSTSVEWETFTAVAIEQVDMSLSAETFTEADSRIKSCTDYKLLQREADSFITLGYHIRNLSFWVRDLLPKSEEDMEKEAAAAKAKLIVETEVREILKAHYQKHQSWEYVDMDALSGTYAVAPARIYTLMKEVREASDKPTETEASDNRQCSSARQAFLDARDALFERYMNSDLRKAEIAYIEFLNAASDHFMGTRRNRPYSVCINPTRSFDDWSVFNFTSWTESIKLLHADLENKSDWVQALLQDVDRTETSESESGETAVVSLPSLHFPNHRIKNRLTRC